MTNWKNVSWKFFFFLFADAAVHARDSPLGGRGGGRAGPGGDGRTAGGGEDGLVLVQLRLELHVLDLQVPGWLFSGVVRFHGINFLAWAYTPIWLKQHRFCLKLLNQKLMEALTKYG